MLLGIVLLYVGAVLVINGIWLIGSVRERAPQAVPAEQTVAAQQAVAARQTVSAGAGGSLLESEAERPNGGPSAPRRVTSVLAPARVDPTFINGKEVAVINVFTGVIGFAIATTYFVLGGTQNNRPNVAAAGFILLFAFTYLWVAANQFLNAGGHAFGWYCLFVAITAVPTGVYTLQGAHGHGAAVWLGISWFAWAVLWFMFFVLLTLERPIARLAGSVAVLEGIGTAWALGYAILEGKVKF
jgi:hypothetical protein